MKQTNKALKAKIQELEDRLAEKSKREDIQDYCEDARQTFRDDYILSGKDIKTTEGVQEVLDELDEPHDTIHEVADNAVPVYNATLLELAAQNPDLALNEPELGPAFDGKPTPINIIAANVFEAIEQDLWEYKREMETEFQELLEKLEAAKV